jgi:hypothetical protein
MSSYASPVRDASITETSPGRVAKRTSDAPFDNFSKPDGFPRGDVQLNQSQALGARRFSDDI